MRRGEDLHRAAGLLRDGRASGSRPAKRCGRWIRSARILDSEHGIVLLQPAYTTYHVELGEISTLPARVQGERRRLLPQQPVGDDRRDPVGRGDRAFAYWKKIAPSFREEISEVHRLEPYVYAQMIAGKDAVRHGEAKNSWLTGTAAWNFVAISQHILGVRPEFDGLRIEPCLPAELTSLSITRRCRGAEYRISVTNSGSGGAPRLTVDGVARRRLRAALRRRRFGGRGHGRDLAGEVRRRPEAGLRVGGGATLGVALQPLQAGFGQHVDGVEERVGTGGTQGGVALARPPRQMARQEHQRHVAASSLQGRRSTQRLPHGVGANQPAAMAGEGPDTSKYHVAPVGVGGDEVDGDTGLADSPVALGDREAGIDQHLLGELLRGLSLRGGAARTILLRAAAARPRRPAGASRT